MTEGFVFGLLAVLATSAQAGGLDLLEVGGAWGTPGADNPTALWWNPSGLALGEGTQVMIEVAPTFGQVTAQRDNPDYGTVDTSLFGDTANQAPDGYDYSGTDVLSSFAPVPFLGLSTDFGVDGLGVGASLSVPFGKAGGLQDPNGPNRFHLREGNIQALYTTLGGSYLLSDVIALGGSVSMVNSWWSADTDFSLYPDLAAKGPGDAWQDGYAELPENSVGTLLDTRATSFTFGVGANLRPRGDDSLQIAVSYNHGVRLDHEGSATLEFRCPPTWDTVAFGFASNELGICNGDTGEGTTANGTAFLGYDLPGRLHLGVVVRPTERLRLEALGGLVFWSAFDEYEIQTLVPSSEFPMADPTADDTMAVLISNPRTWARDHRDTFWAGIDGKVDLSDRVTVGGRALYDHAAIESQSVSANNYDASALHLSAMTELRPAERLGITLSVSHQFLARRVVTDSPYAISVNQDAVPPAYFYPSANGEYSGRITRIGAAVRARFP